MTLTRRELIQAAPALAVAPLAGGAAAQAGALKISHQFPGGSLARRLPRPSVPALRRRHREAATARCQAAVYRARR